MTYPVSDRQATSQLIDLLHNLLRGNRNWLMHRSCDLRIELPGTYVKLVMGRIVHCYHKQETEYFLARIDTAEVFTLTQQW